MTAALSSAPRRPTGMIMPRTTLDQSGPCAIHAVIRWTGQPHRINGRPLVLPTRRPEEAVTELLTSRDSDVWEARIEPLTRETRP